MRPALAVGNGDLWLMSTPNGKRGFFHAEWTEGANNGSGSARRRWNARGLTATFLADEQTNMTEAWFRLHVRVGEAEGRVFSQESIDAAFQDFPALDL